MKSQDAASPAFTVQPLLVSPTIAIRDTTCRGDSQHRDPDDARATQLVFPYRGIFVRHVGDDQAVAEANQVLFFNADEPFRVTHPVAGPDASLSLIIEDSQLRELVPRALLRPGKAAQFRQQRLSIDARAQVLVALLLHSLRQGIAEPLEAETLALTLAQRAVGPRTSRAVRGTVARQRLVDRVKMVLAADLGRRWTLNEIAAEVKGSPVYLTQSFREVEGLPLYRYQLRLRLARALDLLGQYQDLTKLGLDLGFSSHSHFTAAFRQFYGRPPSEFKQSAMRR